MSSTDDLRGEVESVMLTYAMDYEYVKQLQDCAQAVLNIPRIHDALALLKDYEAEVASRMMISSRTELNQMLADGKITIEDAHTVDRFAAFLHHASTPGPNNTIGPLAMRYALGEDVDPEGTGEDW